MNASTTIDPNAHVLEFLHHYCDPENQFDYAVLIRGRWGAGKTFLINKFLKERKERAQSKNLYVSLYGFTSFRQVDEELHRQLHPVLSSKGMKIAAKVARGLLKATTKIDLEDNGKADVTLNASLPDIDLAEYFKTPKECLLIFDDLERCSMPISQMLGYINAFVEHEGFKAIIVANEDEILRQQDEKYAEIKEKLIGQTLQVRSTFDSAIESFLPLIRCERCRNYLLENRKEIELLHEQSQTDNLRLLKYALWDYERLSACFTDAHWEKPSAMSVALHIVVALSFEVRSGRVREEELEGILSRASLFGRSKNEETPSSRVRARYPEVEFTQGLITSDLLKPLLFEGWVNPADVCSVLDQSPYFASPESMPAWKAAWHGWDLEDSEYEKAVAKVEEQFAKREFLITGEILHVCGLRLAFSDVGVISKSRAEVVEEAKAYIDDLLKDDRFPDTFETNRRDRMSWEGLGFSEAQSPEFSQILTHFDAASEEARKKALPAIGERLLKTMAEDPQKYFRLLCVNNVEASPYYDVPVLAAIDPVIFAERVLALPADSQRSVFSAFKGRYDTGMLLRELSDEKPWLEAVKTALDARLATLRPMSKYRLKNRLGHGIDPFLAPAPSS
ncbi:hypothetical protein DYI24_18470 [Rhodopseudomonas sp. BR0C11]|uniref:P-loop NTPase fold protein n=1 Tax=Rhodopseudomonas sp. BR0C11 TaxID=2269370 RepID=UPI0013DED8F1|nr:P-loop NTPase fold protein [Rhodopseudomonas sp. BR0C11]NEV79024.1 hypothetical protein [Rhodopseudomonas sp. BR0C11]